MLNPEDIASLKKFYEKFNCGILEINPDDFVFSLFCRAYIEAKLNLQKEKNKNPLEAFENFITDETHYALVRDGYFWNGNYFEGLPKEDYSFARKRILRACAKSGIDFLNEVRDIEFPKTKRNFRASLKKLAG